MSVTVDAVANSAAQSGTFSSYSWSHTCGASANLLVVLENNAAGTGGVTPTSVTYNSVSLTQLTAASIIGGTYFETGTWYLVNPPTGSAYTVAVTLPSSQAFGGSGSISFSGVNTTTPFYTSGAGTNQSSSGSPPFNVTATGAGTNDLYVGGIFIHASGVTSSSPSTNQWNIQSIGGQTAASGDTQTSSGGTFAYTLTGDAGDQFTAVAVGIQGASSASGVSVAWWK